jgi:hypothetical protein
MQCCSGVIYLTTQTVSVNSCLHLGPHECLNNRKATKASAAIHDALHGGAM